MTASGSDEESSDEDDRSVSTFVRQEDARDAPTRVSVPWVQQQKIQVTLPSVRIGGVALHCADLTMFAPFAVGINAKRRSMPRAQCTLRPLHLGSLPVGAVRELTTVERGALLTLARREGDPQQEIARHEADDSSSPDSQETSP